MLIFPFYKYIWFAALDASFNKREGSSFAWVRSLMGHPTKKGLCLRGGGEWRVQPETERGTEGGSFGSKPATTSGGAGGEVVAAGCDRAAAGGRSRWLRSGGCGATGGSGAAGFLNPYAGRLPPLRSRTDGRHRAPPTTEVPPFLLLCSRHIAAAHVDTIRRHRAVGSCAVGYLDEQSRTVWIRILRSQASSIQSIYVHFCSTQLPTPLPPSPCSPTPSLPPPPPLLLFSPRTPTGKASSSSPSG